MPSTFDKDPEPLVHLAARRGFWDLDLAFSQAMAKFVGCVDAENCDDIFDSVVALCMHCFPHAPDDEMLKMCGHRLASLKNQTCSEGIEDVVQMDEARDFLDADDHNEIQKIAAKATSKREQFQHSKKSMTERRTKSGMASSAGGLGAKFKKRLELPKTESIPQSAVKELSPPGSFVWCSRGSGAWLGRLPPFGEHSRSWSNERGAAVLILRILKKAWAAAAKPKGKAKAKTKAGAKKGTK